MDKIQIVYLPNCGEREEKGEVVDVEYDEKLVKEALKKHCWSVEQWEDL